MIASMSRSKYHLFLGLLVVLMISSCANRRIAKNTVELEPIEVTGGSNIDVYRSSTPLVWDIEHTRVALSFDWKNKTAAGKEWITLHPHFYSTDSLVLDAKGMKIDSVLLIENNVAKQVAFKHENEQVKIKFKKTFSRYDNVTLHLSYTAMPYSGDANGSSAISEDRGLYFINTDYGIPN
ncbi:MAG: hypothetical protein EOP51_19840, partial [Sphingobacteriales bacterium]